MSHRAVPARTSHLSPVFIEAAQKASPCDGIKPADAHSVASLNNKARELPLPFGKYYLWSASCDLRKKRAVEGHFQDGAA